MQKVPASRGLRQLYFIGRGKRTDRRVEATKKEMSQNSR
jgi:hypothetical protein